MIPKSSKSSRGSHRSRLLSPGSENQMRLSLPNLSSANWRKSWAHPRPASSSIEPQIKTAKKTSRHRFQMGKPQTGVRVINSKGFIGLRSAFSRQQYAFRVTRHSSFRYPRLYGFASTHYLSTSNITPPFQACDAGGRATQRVGR